MTAPGADVPAHLERLAAAELAVNDCHLHDRAAWSHARFEARRDHLLAVLGVQLDDLDEHEHTYLGWLAGWDADTAAGVGRLIHLARDREAGTDRTVDELVAGGP